MKVVVTSSSNREHQRKYAVECFKRLGYTDIHSITGREGTLDDMDIICVVGQSSSNLFDKHYINKGSVCHGTDFLIQDNPEAKLCIYISQTDDIYEAHYRTDKLLDLDDSLLIATKLLESVNPAKVEEPVKAIYLSQSSSKDSYHNLKKELPGLDIHFHIYENFTSNIMVMGEGTIVFLDMRHGGFSNCIGYSGISEHFRKLIGRENTFLMYKPNHSNFKIPYIIKSEDKNNLFSFSGVAGTTQKIYDTINSKIKSMKTESPLHAFDTYLEQTIAHLAKTGFAKTAQETFKPSIPSVKDRITTVNRVLLLKKK